MPAIASLECSSCHHQISAESPPTVCPLCAGILYARYDMDQLKRTATRADIATYAASRRSSPGMWRYASVLPDASPVTLGEGWTPLIQSKRYPGLFIKEEGANPTGTSEARGLSLAVTMAKRYGLQHLALASAGNAAGAFAAYAAAAGLQAHLFLPREAPPVNNLEGILYGADVTLVDGLLSGSARIVEDHIRQQKEVGTPLQEVWFDLSSSKEPFRIEGNKTLGYELVEQLGWTYPEAVFYPVGSGAGLIAIWKAFEEMEALGWVDLSSNGGRRPKLYALQAGQPFQNSATSASGLRIPKPCEDPITLDILEKSGGKALAFPKDQILASLLDWAKHEGIFLSPEGAAATAAYDSLLAAGELSPNDRAVVVNTAAGLKYTDIIFEAMRLKRPRPLPTSLPVGGIITPQ